MFKKKTEQNSSANAPLFRPKSSTKIVDKTEQLRCVTGIFSEEVPSNIVRVIRSYLLSHVTDILCELRKKFNSKDGAFFKAYFKCLDSSFAWTVSIKQSEIQAIICNCKMFPKMYEYSYMKMATELMKVDSNLRINRIVSIDEFVHACVCSFCMDPTVRDLSFMELPLSEQYFRVTDIVRTVFCDFIVNFSFMDSIGVPTIGGVQFDNKGLLDTIKEKGDYLQQNQQSTPTLSVPKHKTPTPWSPSIVSKVSSVKSNVSVRSNRNRDVLERSAKPLSSHVLDSKFMSMMDNISSPKVLSKR